MKWFAMPTKFFMRKEVTTLENRFGDRGVMVYQRLLCGLTSEIKSVEDLREFDEKGASRSWKDLANISKTRRDLLGKILKCLSDLSVINLESLDDDHLNIKLLNLAEFCDKRAISSKFRKEKTPQKDSDLGTQQEAQNWPLQVQVQLQVKESSVGSLQKPISEPPNSERILHAASSKKIGSKPVPIEPPAEIKSDTQPEKNIPLAEIVALWNRVAANHMAKARGHFPAAVRHIFEVWKMFPSLEVFEDAFVKISKSSFLKGVKWKVTLGWAVDPENFSAVCGGTYCDKEAGNDAHTLNLPRVR